MKVRKMMVCLTGLLSLLAVGISAYADDDTLRDMGTMAAPGENPKWDGTMG